MTTIYRKTLKLGGGAIGIYIPKLFAEVMEIKSGDSVELTLLGTMLRISRDRRIDDGLDSLRKGRKAGSGLVSKRKIRRRLP